MKRLGISSYWMNHALNPYRSLAGKGQFILDVGGADSPYREFWMEGFFYNIDININSTPDITANITSLPIQCNCIDLVLCTEVLEHVFDTNIALSEIYRVLKPGGHLILSTPLIIGIHEKIDFYRFTPLALEKLLEFIGFRIMEIKRRGGIFSSLGLLLTNIPGQILQRSFIVESTDPSYPLILKISLRIFLMFAQFLSRGFAILDKLDKRKDFTLGIVVLCKKPL